MPDQRRAEKTAEKTRRGDLPVPTGYSRHPGLGDGRPCDGCAETIEPTEVLFAVRSSDAVCRRFHAVCCEVWLKLKSDATG